MQAIILAGGLGTRLKPVIADCPKPMAPINGKPFLAHLLNYLKGQGIISVTLSVHYMHDKIINYFQENYGGLSLNYSIEEKPLGTGGAIVQALNYCDRTQATFVLNGDTFIKLNYASMFRHHHNQQTSLTLALRDVDNCVRYGKVITEARHIVAFKEKGETGPGLINAGVYLLSPTVFQGIKLKEIFSIETDFLFPYASLLKSCYFITDDYFIDIGVPDDYARAQKELHEYCP